MPRGVQGVEMDPLQFGMGGLQLIDETPLVRLMGELRTVDMSRRIHALDVPHALRPMEIYFETLAWFSGNLSAALASQRRGVSKADIGLSVGRDPPSETSPRTAVLDDVVSAGEGGVRVSQEGV